mmetsp:Transcript_51263/g.109125  ORF Transcript_51263/g.109125 Transcript_51263/m.109125 type:complete len:324 (-) Transcript_51263:126-1097(-)
MSYQDGGGEPPRTRLARRASAALRCLPATTSSRTRLALVLLVIGSALRNLRIFHATRPSSGQLVWSWLYYSDLDRRVRGDGAAKKMLVAQSSGLGDSYATYIEATGVVNRAYAKRHGYDYVILQGLALGGYRNWHSTFNKPEVLHAALESPKGYDGVLILDADALLVDFDVDIASLLDDRYALTAQRVARHPHAWNLNIGVALWNLKHHRTRWISDRWREESSKALGLLWNPFVTWWPWHWGDQYLLQWILRYEMTEAERNATLNTVDTIFSSRNGTVVNHFTRNGKDYNDNTDEAREKKLKEVSDEICKKFEPACGTVKVSF